MILFQVAAGKHYRTSSDWTATGAYSPYAIAMFHSGHVIYHEFKTKWKDLICLVPEIQEWFEETGIEWQWELNSSNHICVGITDPKAGMMFKLRWG